MMSEGEDVCLFPVLDGGLVVFSGTINIEEVTPSRFLESW